jgi:hypothetical protein
MGIYILSIAYIREGSDLKGAVLFAILLNLKHIFAYAAPVYFVYLLKNYCFELKEKEYRSHGQREKSGKHWITLRAREI